MRFACWITNVKTHTHILRIYNTYCFPTATLVTRMHLNVTLHALHISLSHLNPPYSTVPRFTRNLQCSKSVMGAGLLCKEGPVLWTRQNVNCAIRWQLPTNWRRATQHGSRNLPLIDEQRQNSSRQLDDMKQFSGETSPLCSINSNT